ncbi:hypothetical protein CSUI_005864 [Cystoisospora suis]|uniref:Transmembrane protein n=1 Tax=Cystoisospora suis TaxID=483139 RepID=A0A2C6KWF7_9APIC|nr:hypothetical protein CSUI_005864 [Cystoisospora suis]
MGETRVLEGPLFFLFSFIFPPRNLSHGCCSCSSEESSKRTRASLLQHGGHSVFLWSPSFPFLLFSHSFYPSRHFFHKLSMSQRQDRREASHCLPFQTVRQRSRALAYKAIVITFFLFFFLVKKHEIIKSYREGERNELVLLFSVEALSSSSSPFTGRHSQDFSSLSLSSTPDTISGNLLSTVRITSQTSAQRGQQTLSPCIRCDGRQEKNLNGDIFKAPLSKRFLSHSLPSSSLFLNEKRENPRRGRRTAREKHESKTVSLASLDSATSSPLKPLSPLRSFPLSKSSSPVQALLSPSLSSSSSSSPYPHHSESFSTSHLSSSSSFSFSSSSSSPPLSSSFPVHLPVSTSSAHESNRSSLAISLRTFLSRLCKTTSHPRLSLHFTGDFCLSPSLSPKRKSITHARLEDRAEGQLFPFPFCEKEKANNFDGEHDSPACICLLKSVFTCTPRHTTDTSSIFSLKIPHRRKGIIDGGQNRATPLTRLPLGWIFLDIFRRERKERRREMNDSERERLHVSLQQPQRARKEIGDSSCREREGKRTSKESLSILLTVASFSLLLYLLCTAVFCFIPSTIHSRRKRVACHPLLVLRRNREDAEEEREGGGFIMRWQRSFKWGTLKENLLKSSSWGERQHLFLSKLTSFISRLFHRAVSSSPPYLLSRYCMKSKSRKEGKGEEPRRESSSHGVQSDRDRIDLQEEEAAREKIKNGCLREMEEERREERRVLLKGKTIDGDGRDEKGGSYTMEKEKVGKTKNEDDGKNEQVATVEEDEGEAVEEGDGNGEERITDSPFTRSLCEGGGDKETDGVVQQFSSSLSSSSCPASFDHERGSVSERRAEEEEEEEGKREEGDLSLQTHHISSPRGVELRDEVRVVPHEDMETANHEERKTEMQNVVREKIHKERETHRGEERDSYHIDGKREDGEERKRLRNLLQHVSAWHTQQAELRCHEIFRRIFTSFQRQQHLQEKRPNLSPSLSESLSSRQIASSSSSPLPNFSSSSSLLMCKDKTGASCRRSKTADLPLALPGWHRRGGIRKKDEEFFSSSSPLSSLSHHSFHSPSNQSNWIVLRSTEKRPLGCLVYLDTPLGRTAAVPRSAAIFSPSSSSSALLVSESSNENKEKEGPTPSTFTSSSSFSPSYLSTEEIPWVSFAALQRQFRREGEKGVRRLWFDKYPVNFEDFYSQAPLHVSRKAMPIYLSIYLYCMHLFPSFSFSFFTLQVLLLRSFLDHPNSISCVLFLLSSSLVYATRNQMRASLLQFLQSSLVWHHYALWSPILKNLPLPLLLVLIRLAYSGVCTGHKALREAVFETLSNLEGKLLEQSLCIS